MDKETFKSCLSKVVENFGFHAPQGMFAVWWNNLKNEELQDEDFEDGCIKAMLNLKRFPALSELLDCCKKVRQERLDTIYREQKNSENKYRSTDMEDLLKVGVTHGNPLIAEIVANTMKLLHGKQSYTEWVEKQREYKRKFKEQKK